MNKLQQACLACAVSFAACCAAADDDALPAVQHQGAVSYISGGIGLDESRAIRAASPRYALYLQFAVERNGKNEFGAIAQVEIRDAAGGSVLSTEVDGPYLLVDLPAGHYSVQAAIYGHAQHKDLDVVQGQSRRLAFIWPAQLIDGAQN